MTILIHDVPGATQADLERGAAAAQAVFDRANVDPYACAMAEFKRSGMEFVHDESDEDQPRMTDEEHRLAALWDEAAHTGLCASANCGTATAPAGWMQLVTQ